MNELVNFCLVNKPHRDAPIQVIEETQEIKAKLEKDLVLLRPHRPEDLRGVIHVVLLQDSARDGKLLVARNEGDYYALVSVVRQ